MTNRFRDPTLRREYEAAMQMFVTKHRNLFQPNGARSAGNSVAGMFWRGFDGIVLGGAWDAVSKKTLGYAHWRAGQDARKLENVAQKKTEFC